MNFQAELLNKVNCIPIHHGVVVHLKHPCQFQICGYLNLSVHHGMIKVYGYNLSTASRLKSIKIFSSSKFESFVIETIENGNSTKNDEILSNYLEKNLKDSLIANLMPNDAVLLIQELEVPYKKALPYMSMDLVPVNEASSTLFPDVLKKCKVTIEPVDISSRRMLNLKTWDNVQLGKINFVQACGGLGKTRFAKYLINKLLNYHEAVLCLDLDVGQNEFVPPGCIALVLIKQPVLGQNFSHQVKVLRMVSIGYMNATKTMKQYTSGASQLVSFAVQNTNLEKYPWVVNTIGLFPELGIGIAQTLLRIIKPTNVITIKDDTNNYIDELRPEKLNMEYKFATVDNGPLEEDQLKRSKDKIWRRSIMIMSYFGSVLTNPLDTFKTIQPYRVELKKLTLAVPSVELNINVLKYFMKSLVSLCERPPFGTTQNVDGINFVINPKVVPCMGLGLVVDINLEKKVFSIISPLSEEEIFKTKLIALSLVPVPQQFFCETIQSGVGDRGQEFRNINADHNRLLRVSRENLLKQMKPLPYNKEDNQRNNQPGGYQKRPFYNNRFRGKNGHHQNRSAQHNRPNSQEVTSNLSVPKAVEGKCCENPEQNKGVEMSQSHDVKRDGSVEKENIQHKRNGPNQRRWQKGQGRGGGRQNNNRQNTSKTNNEIDSKQNETEKGANHPKQPLKTNQLEPQSTASHNPVPSTPGQPSAVAPSQMLPLSAVERQQISTSQIQQLLSALQMHQVAGQKQSAAQVPKLLSTSEVSDSALIHSPDLVPQQPFDRTFNLVCIVVIFSLVSFILGSRNSHF